MKTSICLAVLFPIILLSGCVQIYQSSEGPELVMAPSFSIKGTVISLDIDTNVACEGVCPGREYPIDKGVIRIDKIISINNPSNVTIIETYMEGDEINIVFSRSARPTKIRWIPREIQEGLPLNTTVSSGIMTLERPILIEDGYFIYTWTDTSFTEVTEKVLPGLEVGSKFNATINTGGTIGEYEVIQ